MAVIEYYIILYIIIIKSKNKLFKEENKVSNWLESTN